MMARQADRERRQMIEAKVEELKATQKEALEKGETSPLTEDEKAMIERANSDFGFTGDEKQVNLDDLYVDGDKNIEDKDFESEDEDDESE